MSCTCKPMVLAISLMTGSVSFPVAAQQVEPAGAMPDGVEVIVVSGNKTRLPLWQISNGANTLWLLAYVGSIPRDVQWDYSEVEQIIQDSQEYISGPDIEGDVSPLLYLNPINILRGLRLIKRLQNNPDKQTLADVLPPDLYQRYAELKAAWFPKEKDIELRRPFFAGAEIPGLIYASGKLPTDENPLESIGPVLEEVEKRVRRNRNMVKTNPKAELEIKGRFGALAERLETMVATIPPQRELDCFESGLDFIATREQRQLDTQRLARAWLLSDIDTLMAVGVLVEGACESAIRETSEGEMMAKLEAEALQRWLAATDVALMNNASTFSVLSLAQLIGESGLLQQLEARGYQITPPPAA